MTTRTYSLAEVAAIALPPEWKDPELWLVRRLRRKEIRGYKVGHTWRMRESDVEAMLDRYSNQAAVGAAEGLPAASTVSTVIDGLSARATRRLKAAG